MKAIIIALVMSVTTNALSQFKLRTIENQTGTSKLAYCESSGGVVLIGQSTLVLAKTVFGEQARLVMFYPSTILEMWEDSHYGKLKTNFVFYTSSGGEHQYITYSYGYSEGRDGKWIYFQNGKLIEYCKKYYRVKVSIDLYTWEFSLKNFTSCYNSIFK